MSTSGGGRPASCAGADGSQAEQGGERPTRAGADDSQAEQVVMAMFPVVKRGMASPNRAVFQTALDTMARIEKMFGKTAFDSHLETLADALEKQCAQPGGDARAVQILKLLLPLCSDSS